MIFSAGITDSARKDSVWNGELRSQPSSRAAARHASVAATTSSAGASRAGRRPAAAARRARRGPRRRPRRRRARSAAGRRAACRRRRRRRRRRCARRGRRSSRSRRAAGRSRARGRRRCGPVPRWRSTTAIFARSRAGSATISPVRDLRLVLERVGDDLVGDDPDHAHRRRPVRGSATARRPTWPMRTVWRTQSGTSGRGTSPIRRPDLSTSSGSNALEVGEQQQVGLVAGRDRAVLAQAVPERRVERREHERVLGRDPGRDRAPHHRVDVPLVGDVLGLAVVGAERHPRRAELGDERQQRVEVARAERLADQQPHARRAAARGPPRA